MTWEEFKDEVDKAFINSGLDPKKYPIAYIDNGGCSVELSIVTYDHSNREYIAIT